MFNYSNHNYEGHTQLYRRASKVKTNQQIILNTSYGSLAINLTDEGIIGRTDTDTSHFVIDLTRFDARKAGVSRQHVYIMRDKFGQVFIGDMKSSNGTYLNGTQLVPHRLYSLNSGDILRLGKLTIYVRFG